MEGKDAIFLCYHVWLLEERVYDKRLHLPLASHRKVAWIDQYITEDGPLPHSTNLRQLIVESQSASDSGCNISVRGPMEGERNTTTSSRVMTLCLANPSSLLFPYALYYAVFGQPHSDV
mmetsp:Transcript_40495/g.67672  ORF Transcript_40495/g.67672 Transcript_40495/m.67672 type:complete len:119 (+) Transcript_40495:123-479(+)